MKTDSEDRPYQILPLDRWQAASDGLVREVVAINTVTFTSLIDASSADALRAHCAQEGRTRPTYTAIVIKAISLALREHPEMNRLILRGWPLRFRPVQLHEVHAVVAVERVLQGMDMVYAGIVRHSDRKTVRELSAQLHDLATRPEEHDLRMRFFMRLVRHAPGFLSRWICGLPRWSPRIWVEHRGGSFALTTVGKYGVDSINVKWPWPLTFTYGKVKPRPMVLGNAVVARPSFYLSMGWRRGLCNGAGAARFFNRIGEILQTAETAMRPPAPLENEAPGRIGDEMDEANRREVGSAAVGA